MCPVEITDASHAGGERPRWSTVLRAVREARGVTLDGWAARIGVSRATVQRWERGTRAPDPAAEAAIIDYCRAQGLFRAYNSGPLTGLDLTAELVQSLVADARWRGSGSEAAATATAAARGQSDLAAPVPAGEPAATATFVPDPATRADDQPADPATGSQSRPTSAATPPANLAAYLTSFIGRGRELADVRRVQAGTRLLTLTGAGGSGKTRLAAELARELLWAYPHGVRLAELAPISDAALVTQTVASALGLQSTGRRPPEEELKEFLHDRHLLLVVDNCEHLLGACAALVEVLLRACPHLEVIATSREPLGIAGETVWRVPPMAVPPPPAGATVGTSLTDIAATDAVRLFVERARLRRIGFEPAPAELTVIGEICRRLDGMPLAIELAAARVDVLTIDQIAARLDDRFRLLTGGSRTALPHHQTLRATMAWSHDLLTAPERTLFRRLAVFAGGFTLEAAEGVCGDQQQQPNNPHPTPALVAMPAAEVIESLTRLVEKSLVIAEVHTASPRYRMLETVRQYATEQLNQPAEADDEAVRVRHVAWYAALVQEAERAYRGPDELLWLARLELEHDNLRAAMAWAGEHGRGEQALSIAAALPRFWQIRGHLPEGSDRLAAALAQAGDVPAELEGRALSGLGFLAETRGRYAAARELHERHLSVRLQLGDARGIAEAQGDLGRAAARQGDHAAARAYLEASLAGHRRIDNRPGIASVQGSLGMVAVQQGDYQEALARIEERLALNRAMGNRDGTADALNDLALVAAGVGDSDQQIALLEESMTLWHELNSRNGIAFALSGLGMAALAKGDIERALQLGQESLALYRELGDPRGVAWSLEQLSMAALQQRDYQRAATWCYESLACHQRVGNAWGPGRILPLLAAATFGAGDAPRAVHLYAAAATLNSRLGVTIPEPLRPGYERLLAALRGVLGEAAFAAAWSEGAALDGAAAISYALTPPADGSLPPFGATPPGVWSR